MVTDEHPDPVEQLVTVTPCDFTPGTFTPGVVFELSEPMFAIPEASILMGPGILIDNFQILDPFVAVGDVTCGLRAVPMEHLAILDTGGGPIRMGRYTVSCGPQGCDFLEGNTPPTGKLDLKPQPDAEFPVTLLFDDMDGDIVQAEIAIEALPTEEVLMTSSYRTYDTTVSDPAQESIRMTVPPLPPGDYVALGILDDGIAVVQVIHEPFSIGGTIPTVSEWGIVFMGVLLVAAAIFTISARRRNTQM